MTQTDAARKPCIALLGEFSAGKSTLANALLGQRQSPVRVTATQMPPILYVYGTSNPVRIAQDGSETALADGDVSTVPLENTRAIRVALPAPFLEEVDLMDMPGSSDPNMAADVWEALLPSADIVVWCSPASQAWRQSEAAVWEEMPEALQARSFLLLTRMDKVSAEDRVRVLARVRRETQGFFRAVFPVSLVDPQLPSGDPDAWTRAGLDKVMGALQTVIDEGPALEDDPVVDLAALRQARALEGPDLKADVEPPKAQPPKAVTPPRPTAETGSAMAAPVVIPRRVSAGARRNARGSDGDGAPI